MFDSHCHLHDPRLFARADELLERARAAGVNGLLLAGVEPAGWEVERQLAARHRDVFVSFGVHPQIVADLSEASAFALVAGLDSLLRTSRPIAIGEIGLDALGERRTSLEVQERVLRAQLALARDHDLPIALHVLRAHSRAIAILRRDGVPGRGGVVHSYSGSLEEARRYVELGLHLSVAGPVTYGNASRVLEVVRATPQARLLVETDAPDQTPEPHRPGANEPALLPLIVAAVARARGETADEVAGYTAANARRLFGLPPIDHAA